MTPLERAAAIVAGVTTRHSFEAHLGQPGVCDELRDAITTALAEQAAEHAKALAEAVAKEREACIDDCGAEARDDGTAQKCIARIRTEQRRAEAAEKVVEAVQNARCVIDSHVLGLADLDAALTDYDAAKAKDFKEGT